MNFRVCVKVKPYGSSHPPLHTSSAISFIVSPGSFVAGLTPDIRADTKTLPLLYPTSKSVIGRILSVATLPAHISRVTSSSGIDDPVRMNWSLSCLTSTSTFMCAHKSGTSCYSSISIGPHLGTVSLAPLWQEFANFRQCPVLQSSWRPAWQIRFSRQL